MRYEAVAFYQFSFYVVMACQLTSAHHMRLSCMIGIWPDSMPFCSKLFSAIALDSHLFSSAEPSSVQTMLFNSTVVYLFSSP